MEDLDISDPEWGLVTGLNSTLFNWTSTVIPPNEDANDFNCTDKHDSNIICWRNPEEMRDPAKRNPIFYEIIVTHAVTFIVGKQKMS